MPAPVIDAKNLVKSYKVKGKPDFLAVDGLSFEVAPGESFGLLGPNGAGKSTTMKMISGFLEPTSGTVVVNGHDVLEQPLAVKSAIGYLPEGAPCYGEMTVARFLPGALVGEIGLYAGVPRTARVVAEEPSEVLRIDRPALERMARDHPAVLADFHRLIASILARRLSRTTALLADSEIQAG